MVYFPKILLKWKMGYGFRKTHHLTDLGIHLGVPHLFSYHNQMDLGLPDSSHSFAIATVPAVLSPLAQVMLVTRGEAGRPGTGPRGTACTTWAR